MKNIASTLFLSGFAAMAKAYYTGDMPVTATFSPSDEDVKSTLTGENLGWFLAAFIIFGVLLIMTWIAIWVDECQRHSKLNREISDDEREMQKLGINISEVEREF